MPVISFIHVHGQCQYLTISLTVHPQLLPNTLSWKNITHSVCRGCWPDLIEGGISNCIPRFQLSMWTTATTVIHVAMNQCVPAGPASYAWEIDGIKLVDWTSYPKPEFKLEE